MIRARWLQCAGALAAMLAGAGPVRAQAPPSPSLPPFQSAETCKACHEREYREWRESWMSRAWSARNFQHDYKALQALGKTRPEVSPRGCLRCHAPLAQILRDATVSLAQSREGVTCDFCHSVAGARQASGKMKMGIDPRGVRYGAGPPAKDAPHAVGTSPLLRDPRLCAICHSDFDNNGVPLERTYKEWFQGPYAKEGVVCVDCHMAPTRPGDGRVSHRFPGGHSDSPLLPGAATVEVAKASPAEVLLQVYNARVGHHFPTAGAHPNALYLDVRFLDAGGAVLASHRRRYAFVYLDEQGNEVEGTATAVGTRDTTLGPRERRDERFPVPDNARSVEAVLTYVPLPAHMGDRVGEALYRRAYAPVEIHRARQAL